MSGGAFLGTSAFAAVVLEILAGTDHRPGLVVTLPDRRRGRGRREHPSPVAEMAESLEIPILKSGDVNTPEDREMIAAGAGGWASICAFGQLIREPLLTEVPMLNVHPSLLPRWRGAAPIERAIMAGDGETGVAVMKLVAGLDSGPVALVEKTAIEADDDFGGLSARLAGIGGRLLGEALSAAAEDRIQWTDQDESAATYAEKIEPAERRIDPGNRAAEIERRVRALNPHIGTWLELEGGERLGVGSVAESDAGEFAPGEFADQGGDLVLGCAGGTLKLNRVKPPGGKEMDGAAYLLGHGLPSAAETPR